MSVILGSGVLVSACSGGNQISVDVTEAPKETAAATIAAVTEQVTEPTTEPLTTQAPETKTSAKVYTGIELAGMNLQDIVAVMGEEYDTVNGVLTPAFSSESITYLYNNSILPGFYFTGFQEGNLDTNRFSIAIKDGAKLKNSVSSDMTYNELAVVIGDFDVQAVGGWSLVHYADVDGHSVAFCIEANDYLKQNMSGGRASSELLREANPNLHSIGLRTDR